jgi:hypothetical protein
MKADYDSEGDTIQIELETVERLEFGREVENGAVVVHFLENRPVVVDVIGTGADFARPLQVAAGRHDLDAEALIAAARAALAAPDRAVTLDVAVRTAA